MGDRKFFQGKILPCWRSVSAGEALFIPVLLIFVFATRWPLAPKYLYSFDNANFALAMEEFNPAMHQPQPPGYPLFVALTRLIHLWVIDPERVLLMAGLLAAFAAAILIRILAADMFGRAAGFVAPALLASDPVFWFSGVTNQVRLFLALAAVGVGLLGWRALTRPERPAWFYSSFAALGVAAGFRPDVGLLLLPLLFWVWWCSGRRIRRMLLGMALLTVTALPWVVVTLQAVGGLRQAWNMLRSYTSIQFEGTSLLFGAHAASAYQMFQWAVVWTFLGAVVWIWALPFRWRECFGLGWRRKAAFLAIAFLPGFLFSALIHIGDPDQALAGVAILSVLGGGVLATLRWTTNDRRVFAVCTAAVVLHAVTFFYPPSRTAKVTSYRAVAAVERMNNGAMDAIETLSRQGPLTIVHYGSSVATRHLYYYFPDIPVVVLPGRPGQPKLEEPAQVFYHRESLPLSRFVSGLIGRGSQKMVCLLPWDVKSPNLPGAKRFGAVYYMDYTLGTSVQIGPYKLIPASTVASSRATSSPQM